jgi:hypothetical protein
MSDLKKLQSELASVVGASVPRPKGTLSGHAAGLPFEQLVHKKLVSLLGSKARRHFEFLNYVLAKTQGTSVDARLKAFGPPSLIGLICRGKKPMAEWSVQNLFEEKQNDTAETIVTDTVEFLKDESHLQLLDVKTYNVKKQGQPPNIISAFKLSEALASGLIEKTIRFDFIYVGISWEESEGLLTCKSVSVVSLFKMDPKLYINWAAAEQIQFHPHLSSQDYVGSREDWAKAFLEHFVKSLEVRIAKQDARLDRFRKIVSNLT